MEGRGLTRLMWCVTVRSKVSTAQPWVVRVLAINAASRVTFLAVGAGVLVVAPVSFAKVIPAWAVVASTLAADLGEGALGEVVHFLACHLFVRVPNRDVWSE